MITNKDLSIDSENGKITLNGNKYDLGTQGEIDAAVKDVYSVMGQNGAKNLIPCPYYRASGYSANGMTTTYDSDGVMTINKVAGSSTAFFALTHTDDNYCLKPNTKYKLLAEFDNTTQLSVFAKYGDTDIAIINKKPTGKYAVNFTTPQTLEGLENIAIYASSSDTETNAKVKVMIMLASDTDETYQPYAMTNKQLTEQVAEVKGTIGDLTQTGVTGASVAAQLAAVFGNINPQTSGEWKWIELPGNLVIMWCNHNFGEIGDLVQEGPFYKANVTRLTYPITFSSVPGVWAQKIGNGQGLIIGTGDGGTTTQTPDFTIGRYTSSTLIYGCTLAYFVVGIKATT